MIFERVYQSALRNKNEAADEMPAAYDQRGIHWIINITAEGKLVHVDDMTTTVEKKGKKPIRLGEPMIVPNVGRSSDIRSYLLADDPRYVLGFIGPDDSDNEQKNTVKRHADFVALTKACAEGTGSALVKAVVLFYEMGEAEKLKPWEHLGLRDTTTFRVNGEYPFEDRSVQVWWSQQGKEKRCGFCTISGKEDDISKTGDFSMRLDGTDQGAKLFCSNTNAAASHGREQNFGISVGNEAYQLVTQEFKRLQKSERALSFGDGSTIFLFGDDGVTEPMYAAVKSMLTAPFSPEGSTVNLAGELLQGRKISAFVMSQRVARMRFHANFENLMANQEKVALWQSAATIEEFGSGRPYSLYRLFASAVHTKAEMPQTREEWSAVSTRYNSAFLVPMMRVIFEGDMMSFPIWLTSEVLAKIKTKDHLIPERVALLKVCAVYASNISEIERKNMAENIVTHREQKGDTAFLCGRLLAHLEYVQRCALDREVVRTVADIHYGSIIQKPCEALNNLLQKSKQEHLSALRRSKPKLFHWCENRTSDILSTMITGMPLKFTQQEVMNFHFGYYSASSAPTPRAPATHEES